MDNGDSETGRNRGISRKVSSSSAFSFSSVMNDTIRLEGRDVVPAKIEGTADVFRAPKFVLAKAR